MKLKTLFLLGVATVIGVYTSTKEGSETRKHLKSIGKSMQPVVKDLIAKAERIIEKSRSMKSDEVRLNIEVKAKEVKKILKNLNVDDITKKSIAVIKSTTNTIQKMWSTVDNDIKKGDEIKIQNTNSKKPTSESKSRESHLKSKTPKPKPEKKKLKSKKQELKPPTKKPNNKQKKQVNKTTKKKTTK